MNKDSIATATTLLHILLDKQPGLIQPETASANGGKSVAEFCAGFIQKYSELLDTIQSKSQQ